jgi:glycosyltransferase involved in cell wall biosynthesis
MIFAREVSDNLTSLVKKLDKAVADSKGKMGSFVVFCSDDEKLEEKLKELAKKEKLDKCILAIDTNKAGPYPDKAPFAKDADVTVMLYVNRKVKVNHTFKKGELKEKDVETVIKDLDKILPKK